MGKCENCKYSDTNFWGYMECWKFDQELDVEVTNHTSNRERMAMTNKNHDCKHYKVSFVKYIKNVFIVLRVKMPASKTERSEFESQ